MSRPPSQLRTSPPETLLALCERPSRTHSQQLWSWSERVPNPRCLLRSEGGPRLGGWGTTILELSLVLCPNLWMLMCCMLAMLPKPTPPKPTTTPRPEETPWIGPPPPQKKKNRHFRGANPRTTSVDHYRGPLSGTTKFSLQNRRKNAKNPL